jgi:Flp pilus assembly protein TadG
MTDCIAPSVAAPLATAGAAMGMPRSIVRALAAFRRERRGVAMIEFAVTLPVIIVLLLPMVDIGMGFYLKTQVMTAAEAGAQNAFVKGWNSANIKTAVQSATGLTIQSADITPVLKCGCVDGTTIYLASTTPALPSDCTAPCSNPNNPQQGAYVTVTLTPSAACTSSSTDSLCYKPLFTYGIFGGPVTLTAHSTIRIQ